MEVLFGGLLSLDHRCHYFLSLLLDMEMEMEMGEILINTIIGLTVVSCHLALNLLRRNNLPFIRMMELALILSFSFQSQSQIQS
jgi:hypothetical protein